MGGSEDEIAVNIGGRVGAIGQLLGRDVARRVGVARGWGGAFGAWRRWRGLAQERMGDRDQADEKIDSQRTHGESHRVIVQDLEDEEKVDVDPQIEGRDSQTPQLLWATSLGISERG